MLEILNWIFSVILLSSQINQKEKKDACGTRSLWIVINTNQNLQ